MKIVMWNTNVKRYCLFSVKEVKNQYIFKPLRKLEDLNLTVDESKAKVLENDSTVLYRYLPLHLFMKLKKHTIIEPL